MQLSLQKKIPNIYDIKPDKNCLHVIDKIKIRKYLLLSNVLDEEKAQPYTVNCLFHCVLNDFIIQHVLYFLK